MFWNVRGKVAGLSQISHKQMIQSTIAATRAGPGCLWQAYLMSGHLSIAKLEVSHGNWHEACRCLVIAGQGAAAATYAQPGSHAE